MFKFCTNSFNKFFFKNVQENLSSVIDVLAWLGTIALEEIM